MTEAISLTVYQATAADLDVGARSAIPAYIAVHALGLAGEVGEVLEIIKKASRDGTAIDREHLREELGDVLWYLSQIATDYDYSLEDIAAANIQKLLHRRQQDRQKEIFLGALVANPS